eukprot:XP_011677969.1 PREDICTED: ectonucleotide pyrophosphatase/phosphodiesterase family member 7-like [Strongylocentrotus purpuratus]
MATMAQQLANVGLPTATLPTVADVGLYPESHGAVHNLFFNATSGEKSPSFMATMNYTEWFDTGAEPIWVTTILQGGKAGTILYTGRLYPESHGAVHNLFFNATSGEKSPSFMATMNYTEWFDTGAEPIWVTTILQGGKAGTILYTGSNVPIKGVQPTKNIPINLSGSCIVNVIIASDHGHINSEVGKHVLLYDYINSSDVEFIVADYGPCFQLNPVDGKQDEVYTTLKSAHPALTVYKKEELPERYHYGNNERVLDIFGCVDPGWHLHTTIQGNDTFLISDHGYDNKWMVMKSSFYAQGPHFKKNHRATPFESVDIYSMICEILSLHPAPNNGSRERYEAIFAITGAANRSVSATVPICVFLFITSMSLFM